MTLGSTTHPSEHASVSQPEQVVHTVRIRVLGLSLSIFFAISFVLCVLSYLLFPGLPTIHAPLSLILPGFELLSWKSALLGLLESIAWGWYIALVFGLLYNRFAAGER